MIRPTVMRWRAAPLAIAALVLAAWSARAAAAPASPQQETDVCAAGSTVPAGTVWTAAQSPYLVKCSLRVETENSSLQIDPGVVVKFDRNGQLRVRGPFKVAGASAADVEFTSSQASPQPGDWAGITLEAGAAVEMVGATVRYGQTAITVQSAGAVLRHVLVEKASRSAIYVNGADNVTLDQTVVRDNAEYGMDLADRSDAMITLTLTGNTFERNGEGAVSAEPNIQLNISGSIASGNGLNGIVLEGGRATGPVTWKGEDLPYLVTSSYTAYTDLTLEPGTVVKFGVPSGAGSPGMSSQTGKLFVNGTAEKPVYFTALVDDTACTSATVSCDANNDGSATLPQEGGLWQRLEYRNTSGGGNVTHAEFRYGSDGMLRVGAAGVTVADSKFVKSAGHGLNVQSATTQIERSTFADNRGNGIEAAVSSSSSAPMAVTITNCTFERNAAAVGIQPNVALISSGNQTPNNTNRVNGYQVNGGSITVPRTWRAGDLPFVVADRATVDLSQSTDTLGPSLTIEPGAVVKMGQDAKIVVSRGGLSVGHPDATAKVLITSVKDNACDADGSVPPDCDTVQGGGQPNPGDWYGIEVQRTSDGVSLNHVRILYGGSDFGAGLKLLNGDSVLAGSEQLNDVEIGQSSGYGLHIQQVTTKLLGGHIVDNKRSGVFVEGVTTPVTLFMEDTIIEENGGAAIDMDANVVIDLDDPDSAAPPLPNTIRDNGLNAVAVNGAMRNARVWLPLNGIPYVVTDDVDVASPTTFEIRPGVVVKFEDARITTSRGTLVAEGTPDNPIVFTSVLDDSVGLPALTTDGAPAPGDWEGLVFTSTGGGGRLKHVQIRYTGGANTPAVTVGKRGIPIDHVRISDGSNAGVLIDIPASDLSVSPVSINDSEIKNMFGDAIRITAQASSRVDPTIERTRIERCQAVIRMDANVQLTLRDNTVGENVLNGVAVSGTVNELRRWSKSNLAYVLAPSVQIGAGARLLIEAGTVIKADADGFLKPARNGTLEIAGDIASDPVILTSLRDDLTACASGNRTDPLCDTNGDQDLSEPRFGDWRGIDVLADATSARISGARLMFAGSTDAALIIRGADVTVEHSEISESATNAISVSPGLAGGLQPPMVVIRDNTLVRNTEGAGIEMTNNANVTIEGNRFIDNQRSVINASSGNIITRNNVAVGNVRDAMDVQADIKSNQRWQSDLVRELSRNIAVDKSAALDVDPGTVIQFAERTQLRVANILRAEGAVFTSVHTDPTLSQRWNNVEFQASSSGYIKNSLLFFGSTGSSTGVVSVLSVNQPVEILYNLLLRLGNVGFVVNGNTSPRTRIEGNLIREIYDTRAPAISVLNGARPTITRNRLDSMGVGIQVSNQTAPVVTHNSFTGISRFGIENAGQLCIEEAGNNWWGGDAGPKDGRDLGATERCRGMTYNDGNGVPVTDNVRYAPHLTAPPPIAPLVEAPSCGVTNRDDIVVKGTAGAGSKVQILDGDQVIGDSLAGVDGRFEANVRLAAGTHKLSFQSVSTIKNSTGADVEVASARTGFRVVTVDPLSAVDPAGIRFEYGPAGSARLQPVRDIAGCSTGCGGPSSGRVTLPANTEVRVRINGAIDGAPSKVLFVQPGLEVAFVNEGGFWRTPPFEPQQGSFTLKVDGSKATDCVGYIYLGLTGLVFGDVGASGEAVFKYDFEDGREGLWTGEGDWKLARGGYRSEWAWGNPGDKPTYRNGANQSLTLGKAFNLQGVASPQLTFWHKYRFAAGDRGVVEVRTSDTGGWQAPLITFDTGASGDWRFVTIPLDKYARERRVEFRFRMFTDANPNTIDEGWLIDDVSVSPGGRGNERYDSGEPLVAGARVTLRQRNPDTGLWTDWDGTATGQANPQITGPDGSYGFFSLPPAEYRIVVWHEVYGVKTLDPLPVWDGTFQLNVPVSAGEPIYLPITRKSQ